MTPAALRARILEHLAAGGRTQKEFAAVAGVSEGWLSRFLRGDIENPRPSTLGGIATALGADALAFVKPTSSDASTASLRARYLEESLRETGRVDVRGVSAHAGRGRAALSLPIEEVFLPLRARVEPPGRVIPAHGGRGATEEPELLSELVAAHRRVLVVGGPGSGKTTLLRWFAARLARGKPLVQRTEAPVPVFVRLASLPHLLRREDVPPHERGERVLARLLRARYDDATAAWLEQLLREGRAALLLDGLDELGEGAERARVEKLVGDVLAAWPEAPAIITSRPFGFEPLAAAVELPRAHLEELSDDDVRRFLAGWAALLLPDEPSRREHVATLSRSLLAAPAIRTLARNPVMLTCLCVVHWNERRLPEGKADLVAAVLRWLLAAREDARRERGFSTPFAEEAFKALAAAMTLHERGKQAVVDLAWAEEQIGATLRDELRVTDERRIHDQGRRFLEDEALESGVVELVDPGELRFWHLTFQEHLAARALVERSDDEHAGWWPVVRAHLDDPQWREVLDHFAGALAHTGRRRLHLLVDRIVALANPGELAEVARVVGVLGRLLRVLATYDYQPRPDSGWDELRERALAIFTVESAARVSDRDRLAAARALGQAGDPRLVDPEKNYLPIPGVSAVLLGTYPVTVQEFARFVEDGGYATESAWDSEGWSTARAEAWAAPGDWDRQRDEPNRPVVRVSWHEARAYARWLSARTASPYRLPTEGEWGAAAAERTRRSPWGEAASSPERANYAVDVGAPTPVGLYPAGAGPGGHLDLLGNVAEWCGDAPAAAAARGGHWASSAAELRSALRWRPAPVTRAQNLGFRLARGVDRR